jgi:hypothetical protein
MASGQMYTLHVGSPGRTRPVAAGHPWHQNCSSDCRVSIELLKRCWNWDARNSSVCVTSIRKPARSQNNVCMWKPGSRCSPKHKRLASVRNWKGIFCRCCPCGSKRPWAALPRLPTGNAGRQSWGHKQPLTVPGLCVSRGTMARNDYLTHRKRSALWSTRDTLPLAYHCKRLPGGT